MPRWLPFLSLSASPAMSVYSTGDIPSWPVAGVTSQPIVVEHVAKFGSCGTVSAHQSIHRRVIEDTSEPRWKQVVLEGACSAN